jgi:hypothetical protein
MVDLQVEKFGFFETKFLYVVQDGLELMILLPPPPEYWGYRCVAP